MKWVQFVEKNDSERRNIHVGALLPDGRIAKVQLNGTMKQLIANYGELREGLEQQAANPERVYAVDEVVLQAPIHDPEKIICIGLNYYDHVIESKMEVPKQPVLFPKFNNCITHDGADVPIAPGVDQVDYEVELAVVIGKRAKRVSEAEAMDYVFGYTVANDVSARRIQLSEGQWTRGKTMDGFMPIGPAIVTADEIADPHNLKIRLDLNGERMQDSNTKELIYKIPHLISFLSQAMTLEPGDIISTGTPPGVGMGKNPQIWLKDGDVTAASIEGLGVLTNRYIQE